MICLEISHDRSTQSPFGKPDYSHIVRDTTATISITAAEMAAVLEAYDRGIDTLDGTTRTALDSVISKLKDEVWP